MMMDNRGCCMGALPSIHARACGLQGCYIDLDGPASLYRVLRRRWRRPESGMSSNSRIVSFRRNGRRGTKEDYELLDESEKKYAAGLPGPRAAGVRKLDHSLEGIRSAARPLTSDATRALK